MNFTAEALGTNIQNCRKNAGLTQKQLAAKLNVSFQTVSKWENGKSVPDTLLLPVLAEIFSCSVDALFSDKMRYSVLYPIPGEFVVLWHVVENQLASLEKNIKNKEGVQVIAMFAERSVLTFVNDIHSEADEKQMLHTLERKNVQVERILCVWASGGVDVPSYHFRKGLLDINPENRNAQILLMGTNGFHARSLESIMPK